MSEQQQGNAGATEPEAPTETEQIALPDDHPLVRTLAEQKKAIRELKAKASRLDEIEEANRSDAEKAAERERKAEERAVQAEAKALRREIALDHKLSKEDAGLLDALTDEDAMQRLAARLATASEDKPKKHTVPREGQTPTVTPGDADRRAFVRQLTGRE